MNDLRIVYTPWGNLKKTAGMDVGQVSTDQVLRGLGLEATGRGICTVCRGRREQGSLKKTAGMDAGQARTGEDRPVQGRREGAV